MKKKSLTYDANGRLFAKKAIVFDNTEQMRILANPVAWKIIQLISGSPKYPSQIAKELKIYEQSAYYYIRRLIGIGAVEEVGTNLIRGGTARLYQAVSPAFALELNWGEKPFDLSQYAKRFSNARRFFSNFVKDGNFDGLVVVGAPDPHGPFKSSARDGHYAIQLAFFLGNLYELPRDFIVKLDVDAKAEKVLNGNNIITIGGPGTNTITAEINRYLPIRFDEKNFWSGLSGSSNNLFGSDNHGLIAKINNPFGGINDVVVLAGVRSIGTKSAVIAMTNYSEEILKKHQNKEEWAIVVQGFDMNSDGKIDHVDVVSVME